MLYRAKQASALKAAICCAILRIPNPISGHHLHAQSSQVLCLGLDVLGGSARGCSTRRGDVDLNSNGNAAEGSASRSKRRPGGPSPRRLGSAVALLAVAPVLAACSGANNPMGYPAPITKQAGTLLDLANNAWIAALLVGALVWGLVAWSVMFHRRKQMGEVPPQVRYNMPIEILYTIVPLLMVGVFYVFTFRDQQDTLKLTDNYTTKVNVVGFRWSWAFNYLQDKKDSAGQGVYEVGTPGQPPTLYLPVNEPVRFELTSPDVIHSFWVPQFLFKMDLIPGRLNQFEVTPTVVGHFVGKCAELCGVDHSKMLFWVDVVDRPTYDQKMAELKAKNQTGVLDTNKFAARSGVRQ